MRCKEIFVGVMVLFACNAAQSFAQISPGPLTRAHTQLEGLTKCLACHEIGQQTNNAKCLKCHTAIAQRLQRAQGLHAQLTSAGAKGANDKAKLCATCHSEHHGAEFALIRWEKGEAAFEHSRAGYKLEGQHAQVQCRACHQTKNIKENFAEDATVRVAKTFLGLSQDCRSCHADEHRGQLNANCASCHNNSAWQPAAKFAHERAQFVLTGKHQQVTCAKCHLEKTAREKVGTETVAAFTQYTGLAYSNCTPCHQDPHRGSFGNACVKCHSTAGWSSIRGNAFNHDLTDFPLRGKHRSVVCEKCHSSGDFKKKLAHQACRDCHTDAHAGQFARRADQGRCESCHIVEGFAPARFTLAEHQRTNFALSGAHLAAPCENCHARQTAGALAGKLRFIFPERKCASCHQDVHAGQFEARMKNAGCETCHLPESWHKTNFDHQATRFALQGAHLALACEQCHIREDATTRAVAPAVYLPVFANTTSAKVVRYRPLPVQCSNCHRDVHREQFGKKEQVRCEKCHRATQWRDLLFVHNRDSNFKLEGAHAKVECEKCHFAKKLKDQTVLVIYKPVAKECAACHR